MPRGGPGRAGPGIGTPRCITKPLCRAHAGGQLEATPRSDTRGPLARGMRPGRPSGWRVSESRSELESVQSPPARPGKLTRLQQRLPAEPRAHRQEEGLFLVLHTRAAIRLPAWRARGGQQGEKCCLSHAAARIVGSRP